MKIEFEKKNGVVEDKVIKQIINSLSLLNNGYHVIEFTKPKRNNDQNKLLWKWITCIADVYGQDKDSIYSYICRKYLPQEFQIIERTGGTSKLNTKQFSELLDNIHADYAIEGIELPLPSDDSWDSFCETYKDRL